jgi:hypothetical protein
MTATEAETSQAIAARYAETIETLEVLADIWDDDADALDDAIRDQDDPKRENLRSVLEDIGGGHVELADAIAYVEDHGGVFGAYVEDALDVEITGQFDKSAGRWDVSSVALLLGFGGPTVRYYADGSRIEVAWWGDNGSTHVNAPSFASYVDDLADLFLDR